MVNEAFGWVWVCVGMLTGAWLGMGFTREDHLGGYASWRRRLLRLGHIAFFGTGILNIMFALGVERVALPAPWPAVAGWLLLGGGVLMPVVCAWCAWRKEQHGLFVVPVVLLLGGAGITALGMALGVMP